MSSPAGLTTAGLVVGLAIGTGTALVVAAAPPLRRPTLDARLAPYVQDVAPSSRLLARTTAAGWEPLWRRWLGPLLHRVAARLGAVLGGAASVQRRLERAGLGYDLETFRAAQLMWAAAGGAVGGAAAGLLWWLRRSNPVSLTVLVVLAVGAGFAGRDWWLTHQAERRERLILAEFPTVAEMLALAVGAGEGPVGALERVAGLCAGELSDELRRTLAEARAGAPLTQALQGLGARTELAVLSRFVDGVVVAMERGTPLADVLRGQAQDVREAGQRALLESAGRREIAMMIPVVFGVLPVTVLFAVYPGFAFLRMGL